MVDPRLSASGRGLARTTDPRTPRQAAALVAALLLGCLALLALPARVRRAQRPCRRSRRTSTKSRLRSTTPVPRRVRSRATSALCRRASAASRARSGRCAAARRGSRTHLTHGARSSLAYRRATRSSTSGSCACASELQRSQGVLAKRLIQIYKADQPDMMSVILESDGFNDLLVRADYMSAIGEQDSVIVDKVRALKKKSAREAVALVGPEVEGRRGREGDRDQAARAAGGALRDPGQRGRSRLRPPRQVRQARQRDAGIAVSSRATCRPCRRHPRRSPTSCRAPAPSRRARSARAAGHTSGRSTGRSSRPSGCAGDACTPASTSRCPPARRFAPRPAAPSRWPAGWAATASTPASSTAAALPPVTPTSRRSASAPEQA